MLINEENFHTTSCLCFSLHEFYFNIFWLLLRLVYFVVGSFGVQCIIAADHSLDYYLEFFVCLFSRSLNGFIIFFLHARALTWV